MTQLPPFIHFEPLTPRQKKGLIGYGLLTLLAWVLLFLPDSFYFSSPFFLIFLLMLFLFGYTIWPQLTLFAEHYHALRNGTFFSAWLAFGIIHLTMLLVVNHISGPHHHSLVHITTIVFPSTLPLLLLFQGFRLLSRRVNQVELIIPGRFGQVEEGERKPKKIDKMSSAILTLMAMILPIIAAIQFGVR